MPDSFRDLQSFYRSTLSQSVAAGDSTINVASAPSVSTAYLIIEPNTANEEIVLMTSRSGSALTCTRDLASSGSSESAGAGKAHPAGAAIIIADAHYYIKRIQISKAFEYRGSYNGTAAINAITGAATGDIAIDYSTGSIYFYNGSSWATITGGTTPQDASTTVKGITKMSVAPASATSPIAVGDNDPRVPSQDENDALVGTSGTPSSSNKFVTNDDTSASKTASKLARRDANGNLPDIKFGGSGADGALSVSSGTTSIDLGSAAIVVKNYTSISITGTGAINFTNPHAGGTIIVFKSQGNVTITSSASPAIDLRSLGGVGGAGGTLGGTQSGGAGGGGASASSAGSAAQAGSNLAGGNGTDGTGYGVWIFGTAQTGGGAGIGNSTNASAGGVSPAFNSAYAKYVKVFVMPGSGGGGGAGGSASAGGAGGRGAGALYIECGGAYNCTGIINAAGAAGSDAAGASGGGGGGGGGGCIVVLYYSLTADSGTYTVTGGAGSTTPGTDGGAGANGYAIRALNSEIT